MQILYPTIWTWLICSDCSGKRLSRQEDRDKDSRLTGTHRLCKTIDFYAPPIKFNKDESYEARQGFECYECDSQDITLLADVQLQIVEHDGTVSTFRAQGAPALQLLYPIFGEMDLTKVVWLTNKLVCQDKLKALNVNATMTLVTDKLTAVHFEGLQAGLNETTAP